MIGDCIEIIPYDVYKNKELDRVYLNNYMVLANIENDVKAKLAEKKAQFLVDLNANRFATEKDKKVGFNEAEEQAALQRMMLTTFVLSRLNLHTVTPDKPQNAICYTLTTGDNPKISPLLSSPPSTLLPVSVTHRRNTSTEEVNKKMVALAMDQAALTAATSKAEKIAGFVHQFALNFKVQAKKMASYSVMRRRWVRAIRKVRIKIMVHPLHCTLDGYLC